MEIVVPDEFKYLYVENRQRPIVKIPNGVLRRKAEPVAKLGKKQLALIEDMIRKMQMANGIGLAAPQLGVLQRIIVVATEGMKPLPMINPVITKMEGEQIGQEGCLSIPGLYGDVLRAESIEVEAIDSRGREVIFELEGMAARVVQHEVDHLEGVLFIDKVDPATLHWKDPDTQDEAE